MKGKVPTNCWTAITRWYPWGDTVISLHILQLPLTGGCSGKGQIWTQERKLEFGGRVFWKVKTQSSKICLNFNFLGEGGILKQIPEQGVLRILSTNFALPLSVCLCITDSLSHTTYVETN